MTSKISSSHNSSHSALPKAHNTKKSNFFKQIFEFFFINSSAKVKVPKKVKGHKGAKKENLCQKIFNKIFCITKTPNTVSTPSSSSSITQPAPPSAPTPAPSVDTRKKDDLPSVVGTVHEKKDKKSKSKAKVDFIDIKEATTLLDLLCDVDVSRKDWKAPKGKVELRDDKSAISDEELVVMVTDLHERFAAGADAHEEFATTLHLLEEKVAKRLEADHDFKGACAMRALAVSLPIHKDHPLSGDISKKVSDSGFGTYFSDLDSGVVKGGNIHGARHKIGGKEVQVFDFNISHHARKNLTKTLTNIKANLSSFNSSLPKGYGPISITTKPFVFRGKDGSGKFSDKNDYKIPGASVDVVTFPGKGKVLIGNTKGNACLYKHISIKLDPNLPGKERLAAMQTMCSMLGLGPVFGMRREVDKDRLKMAQLFRAYHPKLAFKIERQPWFYEVSLDVLMEIMEDLMKSKGKHITIDWGELADMTEEEIYPGKKAWCVPDVAEDMRNLGAFGLMAGVGGTHSGYGQSAIDKSAQTVCSILRSGMLSTQDRFQQGLFTVGASSMQDLQRGGGHTVYTRCITEGLESTRHTNYAYQGNIQVLYDLDVVNRVSYGYTSDQYGTKDKNTYQSRTNLLEFAHSLNSKGGQTDNEVMVKNRIAPHYIRALVVQNKSDKDALVSKLKAAGLVKDGKINGKPIDQFIYVANKFTAKMWEKPQDETT